VESLFDGMHTSDQIAQALPQTPTDLVRSDFLAASRVAGSPLIRHLTSNDTLHAHPSAAVHLYFGEADVDVKPDNSQLAYDAMKAAGVNATLVPLGAMVDHPGSEQAALPAIKTWFDSLSGAR
jgi:hypothetical protein